VFKAERGGERKSTAELLYAVSTIIAGGRGDEARLTALTLFPNEYDETLASRGGARLQVPSSSLTDITHGHYTLEKH
jgi:hypothetical protein